tara:strand:+ start:3403 stop:3567 length:165 start_codon:yes stop_codon:yes gene_type:complete
MLYPERKIKAVINRIDDEIKELKNKKDKSHTTLAIRVGMQRARNRIAMLLSEKE